MSMSENHFKTRTIKEIEKIFPGSIVLHLDPTDIQGIPDILILYEDKWAALEFKRSASAKLRPNQSYYLTTMDSMSYAALIFPENKEQILNELQQTFGLRRKPRLSKSK